MSFFPPGDIAKGIVQSQFDEIERLQRIIAELWVAIGRLETTRERFYAPGHPDLKPMEAQLAKALLKARSILA